ncbi:HNH endonuclease [Candidatus Peregrinibacteria bacterium]|jgi:hypothetical protein|nr:HNH endonuclease [Candidatus Peregrinibacteria bacterium]MBT7483938.1 HNH endonuclease [Candidatus Peregrinibacteria bacterium]MBT7703304.1 HNH endonuclease [Candidatus Peregrinibacteria bacterium]
MKYKKLSDSEFYQLCKKRGRVALLSKRQFAALLPEAKQRRTYRRHGCSSIHEFAAKLGGMSYASVDKILNLSEKLKDKPTLRAQLESGEQGWSKIEKVAYIATPATEKEWAQKVANLPQTSLEKLVQINRGDFTLKSESQPEKRERFSFEVNEKIALRFRQFKQKIEKERGETLSFGEVLEELFVEQSQPEKQITIQVCPECTKKQGREKTSGAMPVAVKKLVSTRQNNKCLNCNSPIECFHHTKRFAIKHNHDPDFIVGLCKKCHNLVHSSLVPNEQEPNWQILEAPDMNTLKWAIDQKVLNYRLLNSHAFG